MLPLEIAAAFFAAAVVLALSPGPDNLYVLSQSALRGARVGLAVTLGLCTGLIVHTTAVALGVAALVQASATAFTALKLLGAGYLLFLAWDAFRAAPAPLAEAGGGSVGLGRYWRRGVLMNLSNPKVTIFFLAFLPQFASPLRGPMLPQLVLLGALFMLAALLVFSAIALLAGRIGPWLARRPRVQVGMQRLTGALFAGLALSLLASDRNG
jgi:threonine/homoserine/homoserine lactone efflux protein